LWSLGGSGYSERTDIRCTPIVLVASEAFERVSVLVTDISASTSVRDRSGAQRSALVSKRNSTVQAILSPEHSETVQDLDP
jgi:hypothetical protein